MICILEQEWWKIDRLLELYDSLPKEEYERLIKRRYEIEDRVLFDTPNSQEEVAAQLRLIKKLYENTWESDTSDCDVTNKIFTTIDNVIGFIEMEKQNVFTRRA
jgi:hypothetical protein